jgi:GSH-dependent disulfide-bond oxidoreductase
MLPATLVNHAQQETGNEARPMIDFYFHFGPNPMKVALFLEEAGLAYNLVPVDIFRGEQLLPEFTRLNPNNKLPVLVDDGVTVFDSNAILLYRAEKYDVFRGAPENKGALLSWLMFTASGVGPYFGQAVHFRNYAPKPNGYGVERYDFEARRHFGVLEDRLSGRAWMVGSDYSIVDMAVWGWVRNIDLILGAEARADFPNVVRFFETIEARPAAQSAASIPSRYNFKASMDDDARRAMFRHAVADK